MEAIRAGDIEEARFWLEDDTVHVSAVGVLPNGEVFLPLRDAIGTGSGDMVKLLLEEGADARAVYSGGRGDFFAPLLEAVRAGSVDIVRLLLEAGAPARVYFSDGSSPMGAAIALGNREIVELLRDARQ